MELRSEFGEHITPLQADFADPGAVAALADEVLGSCGAPTGIVHLPALRLVYERFTKFDLEHFNTDMAVQVQSPVILLRKLLPKMAKLSHARVVFILSSVVHGVPPKFMSMYTTVKYAQLGLMRSLASEYAASPVRINAISPGMVETQFLQNIAEVAVQMSASSNPAGRNATPADLLGAIQFLLSASADYIHGVDIPVTGGSIV